MEQTIYLPTGEETGRLIQDAWKAFCEQAEEAGYNLNEEMERGFLQDGFAAGYCAGWNDCLGIIRDQLNAGRDMDNILKKI